MTPRGLFAVGLGIAGTFAAGNAAYVLGTGETVVVTVKDKERIVETGTDSDGYPAVSSKYLIFTDKETFENTDSVLKMKFNSSDVYGALDRGSTYECEVYGWRIPAFSQYRNIVSCAPAGR